MINWAFLTIIVPASHVEQARELGAALDPSGAGMYTTPLSETGSLPATHYISSGLLDEQMVPLLNDANILFYVASMNGQAQGLTLTATLEETTYLVANSDVSVDPPFDAMARLGLKMIVSDDLV